MRRFLIVLCVVLFGANNLSVAQQKPSLASFGKIPLHFVENEGQFDSKVKFMTRGMGATMFFTAEGTTFLLKKETEESIIRNYKRNNLDLLFPEYKSNDPDIEFSTFIGSEYIDEGIGIAVDNQGNSYIVGSRSSGIIVIKLNPSGNKIIYTKSLGSGSANDIVVDNLGYAYVTGRTSSIQTTANSFDESFNGGNYDAFVSKINLDGDGLIFSTYIGGKDYDEGYGIAIDSSKNIFVTGVARSNDFPTTSGVFKPSGIGIFVSKIDSSGNFLIYSTYVGDDRYDMGRSIAIDLEGNAFVTGQTNSIQTTINSFDDSYNGGIRDAFVFKLNPDGRNLIYSTYLGGTGSDSGSDISIDKHGNTYITGYTESGGSGFPANGKKSSGFVSKLNSDGSELVYSTFIKSGGTSIVIDDKGSAFVISTKTLVHKLNPSGSNFSYSKTLYSVDNKSYGRGIAFGGNNQIYLTGSTRSVGFPTTPGVVNENLIGETDIFVTKINVPNSLPIFDNIGNRNIFLGDSLIIELNANDINEDTLSYSVLNNPSDSSIENNIFKWIPSIEQVGSHEITFLVSDGFDLVSQEIIINVLRNPEIEALTDTTTYEGEIFQRKVIANDADEDILSFSLTSSPSQMSINTESGLIFWTPNFTQSGTYNISVKVEDGTGGEDSTSFSLMVENVNRPPKITTESLKNARVNILYSDTLESYDSDIGDKLNYTLLSSPQWLSVKTEDPFGILSGTPSASDSGTSIPIFITVSDSSGLSDTLATLIDINQNTFPVIENVPDTTIFENEVISINVLAEDSDGDNLTFSLETHPEGMSIDSTTGVIDWTPSFLQAGTHNVSINAEDMYEGKGSESFSIEVIDVNRKPFIISSTISNAYEGIFYSDTIFVQDEDEDDTWNFDIITAPSWLEINTIDSLGIMFGTPNLGDAGNNLPIFIQVSDRGSLTDTLATLIGVYKAVASDGIQINYTLNNTDDIEVSFSDNSSLTISFKSGDISNETLTLTKLSTLENIVPSSSQFLNPASYYNITTSATNFSADLTFGYNDSTLSDLNLTEDNIVVSFYDSLDSRGYIWYSAPSTIDPDSNTITVSTSHFSLWAIVDKNEELITSIEDEVIVPDEFLLFQNYPNPFNPVTSINFKLKQSVDVILNIYDIKGQLVKTLISGKLPVGSHTIKWDGANEFGIKVSSGVYMYRIIAGSFVQTKKMVLIK